MNNNKKILILRYSDSHGIDTIKEHSAVIQECGSCWWAKIGKQPSPEYIEKIMQQEDKIILLYTAGILYRATLLNVMRERPQSRYPAYYEKYIFNTDQEPSVYFELSSIVREELTFLEDYVISSSGKEALYDLKKTISSYMFVQHKSIPIPQKPKRVIPEKKKVEIKYVYDRTGCVYKKNGKCTNKSCVNYQYECTRPQYCLKQKPIKKLAE